MNLLPPGEANENLFPAFFQGFFAFFFSTRKSLRHCNIITKATGFYTFIPASWCLYGINHLGLPQRASTGDQARFAALSKL
ncbi:hypothetical protein [Tahibacter aquaticus]|nr:hypothetical protein [Tahibacter aquaticus]